MSMCKIVSVLTPKVNTLTKRLCKLADMKHSDLAGRARMARIRAGYKKEIDAAKAIGCSRPLVIRWESGSALSIGKYLLPAARAYRVRPEWLNLGSGEDGWPTDALTPVASSATRPNYVRFPLLEGFAGMGRGDYVGDYPEIVDWVEVTREWATQKLRGVPHTAIRVITGRGQSMRGTYNDGDLIFLDSRIKQFNADAAYCYRWDGKVHIKRLQQVGKGKVRIISANPEWPAIEVKLADLEIGGMALAAWTLTEF